MLLLLKQYKSEHGGIGAWLHRNGVRLKRVKRASQVRPPSPSRLPCAARPRASVLGPLHACLPATTVLACEYLWTRR